jgi:small-conductance mechanosensitive channel
VQLLSEFLSILIDNLREIIFAFVIAAITLLVYREVKHVFNWVRSTEKLPVSLVDVLESLTRYIAVIIGVLLLVLNLSAVFALQEPASKAIPGLILASATLLTTWFSVKAISVIFDWLLNQEKMSPDLVGTVELFVKYSIILLGGFLLFLDLVAALGYGAIITTFFLSWIAANSTGIVFIIILLIITRIASRIIDDFFKDVHMRTRFQPQIIEITGKVLRYFIYFIAGLILFTTFTTIFGLPTMISQTVVQLLTILVGVSVSFAASGTIGNFIAGLILMSWRPFKEGDRVEVGKDAYGDVVEVDIVFTKVKTIKDEIISVPNLQIIGNSVTNYSSLRRVIVHTAVSVGYDIKRDVVEDLLIEAALNTEWLLNNPKPFVFIKTLANFWVEYELNAYTERPSKLIAIYSDLHKSILDSFNKAGVELLSPHYLSLSHWGKNATSER